MAENTKIEWCDHTFNPWEGCTKVSPGCANCYAEARNHRYGLDNWGKWKPRRRTSAANWAKPLKWNRDAGFFVECMVCGWRGDQRFQGCGHNYKFMRKARPRVFCASLADWLDEEVPIEWLADLLSLWFQTPNLDWLALTKRLENFLERITRAQVERRVGLIDRAKGNTQFAKAAAWLEFWRVGESVPPNVWIGTTVENQEMADKRIPELLKIPAKIRFLSCEPLLGPVDLGVATPCGYYCQEPGLDLEDEGRHVDHQFFVPGIRGGIHWVICGGESGPNARPMHPDWARSLRDQCVAAGVPFFFKQWGNWAPIESPEQPVRGPRQCLKLDGSHCDTIFLTGVPEGAQWVEKVGKKAAGRLLDGREWSEFPNEQLQTP